MGTADKAVRVWSSELTFVQTCISISLCAFMTYVGTTVTLPLPTLTVLNTDIHVPKSVQPIVPVGHVPRRVPNLTNSWFCQMQLKKETAGFPSRIHSAHEAAVLPVLLPIHYSHKWLPGVAPSFTGLRMGIGRFYSFCVTVNYNRSGCFGLRRREFFFTTHMLSPCEHLRAQRIIWKHAEGRKCFVSQYRIYWIKSLKFRRYFMCYQV